MRKTPILYCDDGSEIELPFKWKICGVCEGHNRSCAHVEMDGGGFTASEWAEQDDEFKDDYLAGRYDRPCPHCEGGKVKVADRSRMTPEQRREWKQQCEDDAEIDAIHAMERRMGA